MRITNQRDDEIIKHFADNEYVGYTDENGDLYGFTSGRAALIETGVAPCRVAALLMKWIRL